MAEKIIYQTKSGPTKITVKKIGAVYKLVLDDTYVHSAYSQSQPLRNEDYWDYLLLGRLFLNREPEKICVLGLGGGTAVHLFETYLKPTQVDAVEIDPVITRVAKKFFSLNYPNLNIYVGDAKEFIRLTARKYDLITVDLFNPRGQEPSGNTPEFFRDVRQRLSGQGVVVVNHFDTTPRGALIKTFKHIYAVTIHLNRVYFCTALNLTVDEVANRLAIFLKTNPDFEVFKEVKINKLT